MDSDMRTRNVFKVPHIPSIEASCYETELQLNSDFQKSLQCTYSGNDNYNEDEGKKEIIYKQKENNKKYN